MRSNKAFQGVFVSKILPFSLLIKRLRQSWNVQVRGAPIAEAQMHVDTLPLLSESSSPTDRRQQTLSFSLTGDQLGKMKAPGCVPSPLFRNTPGSHPFWGKSDQNISFVCSALPPSFSPESARSGRARFRVRWNFLLLAKCASMVRRSLRT